MGTHRYEQAIDKYTAALALMPKLDPFFFFFFFITLQPRVE